MRRSILESRVGLRVLAMFVLAAGAPMLLLALLSQRTVDATLARSEAVQMANTAKTTGLQTLERLRLAQQNLAVAHPQTNAPLTRGQPAPLQAIVEVDPLGARRVVHGGEHAAALLGMPAQASAGPPVRLQVVEAAGLANVVLVDARPDGSARLGLVDPAFLWDGAGELPAGLWLCVLATGQRPLFCSESADADAAIRVRQEARQAPAGQASRAVKGLFLGADFNAPDWDFVAGVEPGHADAATQGVRSMLPIAATAGLLLALLLGLVQTRRTMSPLLALAGGAREIAQRRFGTRLDIRSADEFGELAGAFNEMATRLEAQFAELEALAAIDRDIVGHNELQRVQSVITERLQQVLPQRAVALAYLTDEVEHRAAALVALPGVPGATALPLQLDAAACAGLAAAGEWLALDRNAGLAELETRLEGSSAHPVVAMPLRWRERCFGFIAIGPGDAPAIDGDALRQVLELRNRAAIAASAAHRERRLWREARYDGVTGLLNRQGLDEQLRRLVAESGPGTSALAVLFIDVDRFKSVNDSLGHAAGDRALRQVAERLRDRLPARGVAARPAGDEFVMLLPAVGEGDTVSIFAQAVCDGLAQAIVVDDTAFFLHASVGVVLCTDPQADAATLLRSADHAMYQAKRRGGGRFAVFDAQRDAQALRRSWIETDLPLAGQRGQLQLLYQPRIDLARARMTSVEALIRWNHPVHGLCSPGEFIAIAEESELIEHVGRWVIDAACAQLRAWRDQGIAELRVAINLSGRQLGSDRLLPDLRAALARHGIRAEDLELEITESLLIDQTGATVARLHELRRMGMTLALDDFGTGYSSMSYLRSLPIDILKIDRAFVKDLGHDRTALAVARAIVALASSLGMRTVAEGVETHEQWHVLEDLRCDEVQGYLFSKPIAAAAIGRLVAGHTDWARPPGSSPAPTPALASG